MGHLVKVAVPSADRLSFRFVSGHRALDFVATFGDRHGAGVERLGQPADLDRWLGCVGFSGATRASARDLAEARQLREAINRLARAALLGTSVDVADLDVLNAWARAPRLAPQLDTHFHREWDSLHPPGAALSLIACEAVDLLSGPERRLIRECAAAPACSLLYLDRSRGHRRRWCEMQRCGSRAKMAEYRKRHGAPNAGAGL